MKRVTFTELSQFMMDSLTAVQMTTENAQTMIEVYISATKRGVGHHDIYDFPARLDTLLKGKVTVNPVYKKLAGFGCMESWDGDNGLGELINSFIMDRAITLAQTNGIGFCTVRNSNHFLAGAPYVLQAAQAGCIGLVLAKGPANMGVPGSTGNVVGHSPMAFGFPTNEDWPVMMDICLAYASIGQLTQRVKEGQPIPSWWGVGPDGESTSDPAVLLKGVRYPIGEHKGFGLAILSELLTGVLSSGLVLNQNEDDHGLRNVTSHTALAIKVDALMDRGTFLERSSSMIERIKGLSPDIHIPGSHSYHEKLIFERTQSIEISDELFNRINEKAAVLNIKGLQP